MKFHLTQLEIALDGHRWTQINAIDEHGNAIMRAVPDACDLDLEGLRGRLGWLAEDVEQCESKIKELSDEQLDSVAVRNAT